MEDIKFIKAIMSRGNKEGKPIGNCMYYDLHNQRLAKIYVTGNRPGKSIGTAGQSHGIMVDVFNKSEGKIDNCYFPFQNYFEPVQRGLGAGISGSRLCYNYVDNGSWNFPPTESDYKKIAYAVEEYIGLFE